MSFHRAELFEALADARWRNEPSDGDDLDRLIDNFAHELAEKIRNHSYDPGEVGPVHVTYQLAADLIDPEVER
ncbi:hypothetical protein ACFWRC_19515 [Streptomyces albidoflavus]